jgi:glutathione S-transferase
LIATAGEHGRAVAVFGRAAQELRVPRYEAAAARTADFIEQRLAGRRFPDGGEPSASDLAGVVRGLRAVRREAAAPLAHLEKLLEPTTHRFLAASGNASSALPEPLAVEALALDAAPNHPAFRDAALAAPFTPEIALALRRANR